MPLCREIRLVLQLGRRPTALQIDFLLLTACCAAAWEPQVTRKVAVVRPGRRGRRRGGAEAAGAVSRQCYRGISTELHGQPGQLLCSVTATLSQGACPTLPWSTRLLSCHLSLAGQHPHLAQGRDETRGSLAAWLQGEGQEEGEPSQRWGAWAREGLEQRGAGRGGVGPV